MRNKLSEKITAISFISVFLLSSVFLWFCYGQDSADYVNRGWSRLGERKFEEVREITNECIQKFSEEADRQAEGLSRLVPAGPESPYRVMNNVATCYFIKAESYMRQDKNDEAINIFHKVSQKYPYAQSRHWHGWDWSIKEVSQESIQRLETGEVAEIEEIEAIITEVNLHYAGERLPINYKKYGKFKNLGTKDYKYVLKEPVKLADAVGAGVYPNTNAVRFDPQYQKIRDQLHEIDHWEILHSRDLSTAFYKWINAPEPNGIRQFYLAEILERSGLIEQAIKAYYAILVHFPRTHAWTYWETPWFVGPAALHRIKYLLEKHPELGLKLEDAEITIVGGFDGSIRGVDFVVNPGRLVKKPFWQRLFPQITSGRRKRKLTNIEKETGERVRLIKYKSGDWQLKVNGEPFMIQAITYDPTRVGESPDEGTQQDWTRQDTSGSGLPDAPYEAWLDKNWNNQKDPGEKRVGDFQLMADMGVNAIRLYHHPFERDIEVIRDMYESYGIYTLMGDFLGKYTLGSGARWEEGADYTNPEHRKNMLESVKKMVEKYKNEEAILIWLLGNENVYGFGCNADTEPVSFFQFANEAANLIKELDPEKRPVAIVSGDTLYLDLFAKHAPDIDIFGTNSYRGKYGFLGLFDDVRRVAQKPAMITEYGAPAYGRGYTDKEAQKFQAEYHKGCWQDIKNNSAGFGSGNALGGIVFQWVDEWWKSSGEANRHSRRSLFTGPFLDGFMYEEWLGLMSQGDGTNSPFMRQPRKSYYMYKELWN